jgi:hypothetical protein
MTKLIEAAYALLSAVLVPDEDIPNAIPPDDQNVFQQGRRETCD